MIRRRSLLSTALAATAAVGLAACSDDSETEGGTDASDGGGSDGGGEGPGALEGVTISEDLDSEPVVEFDAPIEVTAADSQVVVEGEGDPIGGDDVVIMRSAYVDASSGETLQSWWQGAPASGLVIDPEQLGEQAAEFFTTVTVGSRFAMAGWQSDESGQSMSLIQVGDIDRVVSPLHAEGEPVEPSGDFPAVTLDDSGAPSLESAPEGDEPTETISELLIEGTGDETREGDYLTMHYTGWTWSDGEEFDSSWERGTPFSFIQGAGQVITGWDEQLLELPVGSQLMLVIPPEEAYGDEGDLAGETLVFVIDILDAAHDNA